MKTLKRVIAVSLVATFAMVAFAIPAPADHTEARLTLAIEPEIGPVGQTINAQLPDEAFVPAAGDECAASNVANQTISAVFAALAGDAFTAQQTLEGIAASILSGAFLDGTDLANTLQSVLFPLVFADVATQEPLSDPSFWNPTNGQGSIVAPGTDVNTGDPLARPAIYAVAATCLGLKDLDAAAAAAVAALTDALGDLPNIVTLLTAFGTCVAGNPANIPGCVAAFAGSASADLEEILPAIIETLLLAVIDQDPDIAWAALFCLTGDNFETCEGPPVTPGAEPAAPVQAVARFTG